MYHNHIDLEYYLNTVVMASWFTVLCANNTTTAPSIRWYFQRIFQKLEISSMTLLSRHGVWSVGWGERRMWQRRMWFCWPVTCALCWQSTELIYSISCCIQHTHNTQSTNILLRYITTITSSQWYHCQILTKRVHIIHTGSYSRTMPAQNNNMTKGFFVVSA